MRISPRGVAFETVITGIRRALAEAQKQLGLSDKLILCFLRHLNAETAIQMALHLDRKDTYQLVRNSFQAAFLSQEEKQALREELDNFMS